MGLGLLLALPSYAVGDSKAGEVKSKTCVACHGPKGRGVQSLWPKLAGQNSKYLQQQLQAFKKGKDGGRYDASMEPMVAPLSSQDIEDLAAFYANQKSTIETAQAKDLALGQELYRGGDLKRGIVACGACHGPKGLGNPQAGFPRLSGQYAAYVDKQLHDYKAGARPAGINGIMQQIAARMTDKDMQAVANYISGLY